MHSIKKMSELKWVKENSSLAWPWQSIEQRIVISGLVETTDQDKYANGIFESDCFIDLEVSKLWKNFL